MKIKNLDWPDWPAARSNRQDTRTLIETQDFPKIIDFVTFMSMEADISCYPVTSFGALCSSDLTEEKTNHKDGKRNRAHILHTQTAMETDQRPTKGNYKRCSSVKTTIIRITTVLNL